ncbi:tetratricopeptide (TPR) repeat protein [Stakelama sediminis]|uniref:Tetratricopeptide (TPR) repeat protein n=1 Tax=Stakelama sediminis TaxID=463200 RepID=A0A840Z2Z4_9SPHN|nr:tetratricopeptide repeat protein [Stakelama sediminis]MBB5720117.1 tetratricopeptide (TPR) repeat protein [Stakelama sediminis]
MSHFDDLPKRSTSHVTEDKAEAAFTNFLSVSEDCLLQKAVRKDYGTDCEIEVVDQGRATNVRIHVQLKGTEKETNADGSISVAIGRANLNYLLMHPYSLFVCYHVPTGTLWARTTESVLRQYEHANPDWAAQQTLTVNFTEELTSERLRKFAELAKSVALSSRDKRIEQTASTADEIPDVIRRALPDLHIGDDAQETADVLAQLYESGADELVSANFGRFAAVLNADHDAMGYAYMAEINLGMAGREPNPDRITAGMAHFASRIGLGRYHDASLHYTVGNGLAALGRDEEAATEYRKALENPGASPDAQLLAQTHKNLGSSLEKLGKEEQAAEHYREALRLSPNLAEAHHALASYHHRHGNYQEALDHFDKVVFLNDSLGKQASVAGWRINVLFQLGDAKGAFREINRLIVEANTHKWIWPWCARQLAIFGRASDDNARLALTFWDRLLAAHPHHPIGKREQLLAKFYLRAAGEDPGSTYSEIKVELETGIQRIETEACALLWDRLGHWAQDDENWNEAEFCFRKAYDLVGGHYGYCLGTALNFLGRCEESLPILQEQAETLQPDAMSWFQVAVANEKLGRTEESIEAYREALLLDPEYSLAWFNLGGVHWNNGDMKSASEIWKAAVEQFPEHQLSDRLRSEIPFVLL